jgi:hypothetical protein
MKDAEIVSIECGTCPATGTTACSDCIVTHLLANDDGPIQYATTALRSGPAAARRRSNERAIRLLAAAGLLDDPPRFVDRAEFEGAGCAPGGRR